MNLAVRHSYVSQFQVDRVWITRQGLTRSPTPGQSLGKVAVFFLTGADEVGSPHTATAFMD